MRGERADKQQGIRASVQATDSRRTLPNREPSAEPSTAPAPPAPNGGRSARGPASDARLSEARRGVQAGPGGGQPSLSCIGTRGMAVGRPLRLVEITLRFVVAVRPRGISGQGWGWGQARTAMPATAST